MYYGESLIRLDDKGRIMVPRRIRETMDVLGHAIWYMTRGYDGCITLFHRDEWKKIEKQMSRYSAMDTRILDFRRFLFGGMVEVKPDGQGRIPVPVHLREYAGIGKEAVLVGVDEHLELWSKESWQGFIKQIQPDFKKMAREVFMPREISPEQQEKDEGSRADEH